MHALQLVSMVRVWVAGKTVWSPCYTWAISECFRDNELKCYKNSAVCFIFYTVYGVVAPRHVCK